MAEKKTISAREVVADIKARTTDEQLMSKHGLSAKGLESLKTKLLTAGLLTREELERKSHPAQVAGPSVDKRALAKSIAESVQNGLPDAEITKRFGISTGKLPRVYTALIKAGYLTQEDLDRRGTDESAEETFNPAPESVSPPSNSPPPRTNVSTGADQSGRPESFTFRSIGMGRVVQALLCLSLLTPIGLIVGRLQYEMAAKSIGFLITLFFCRWIYYVHKDLQGFFEDYPISPGGAVARILVPLYNVYGMWDLFSTMSRTVIVVARRLGLAELEQSGRSVSGCLFLYYSLIGYSLITCSWILLFVKVNFGNFLILAVVASLFILFVLQIWIGSVNQVLICLGQADRRSAIEAARGRRGDESAPDTLPMSKWGVERLGAFFGADKMTVSWGRALLFLAGLVLGFVASTIPYYFLYTKLSSLKFATQVFFPSCIAAVALWIATLTVFGSLGRRVHFVLFGVLVAVLGTTLSTLFWVSLQGLTTELQAPPVQSLLHIFVVMLSYPIGLSLGFTIFRSNWPALAVGFGLFWLFILPLSNPILMELANKVLSLTTRMVVASTFLAGAHALFKPAPSADVGP